MRSGILTLTTDFGADGPYVASLKGIVLGLAPGTQVVDVSHAIAPQDVAGGAFVLAEVFDSFPKGTVHLAVIDPGVGTDRLLIVVEVGEQWFVLPDNGLMGGVLKDREASGIWEIRNPDLRRASVSATFHGRDILAPVAAHLLRGGDPADVGPTLDRLVLPSTNEPVETDEGWAGEVVFVDPFGNLITNITRRRIDAGAWSVEILGRTISRLVPTYGEQTPGTLVALLGSSDRVEVSVVNGSASRELQVSRGTSVILKRVGGVGSR